MCVGWGGAREGSPPHAQGPALTGMADPDPTPTAAILSGRPPDHFIWLQCMREDEET